MDYAKINQVYSDMVESILKQTGSGEKGYLAIKFTALISLEIMTKASAA